MTVRVQRAVLAAIVAMGAAGTATQAAWGAGDPIDRGAGLPDRDVRSGHVKPTAAQRSEASDLGAQVAWNQFGTPSSLVDPGGTLATGVTGATASDAARSWLDRNKALFKLSTVKDLALAGDNQLAASDGHAVTFR